MEYVCVCARACSYVCNLRGENAKFKLYKKYTDMALTVLLIFISV